MKQDLYKPSDVSDEEWEELKSEMRDRNVDNSDHHTVQLRIKKMIKWSAPVIISILAVLGYYVFTQYQEIVYTVIGVILAIVFVYLYLSTDYTPGEQQ